MVMRVSLDYVHASTLDETQFPKEANSPSDLQAITFAERILNLDFRFRIIKSLSSCDSTTIPYFRGTDLRRLALLNSPSPVRLLLPVCVTFSSR